jgi:two-component system nitrate/nitrite response regulator NarL
MFTLDNFKKLTTRERQIAPMVADGLSNKAIANQLGITEGTVKAHLRSLMRKTGVRNRTMLATSIHLLPTQSRKKVLGDNSVQ